MTKQVLMFPLVVAACGGPSRTGEAPDASAFQLAAGDLGVQIARPGTEELGAIVLGATREVRLRDRADVTGEVASTGAVPTRVGNDATLDGDVVSEADVVLGHRTDVSGTVRTAGVVQDQPSTTTGAVVTGATLGMPAVETLAFEVPDTSNGTVHLQPDQTASVPVGRYDDLIVKSRSTAFLSTGTYFLDRLQLEPQSTLHLDDSAGPVVLVIGDAVIARGDVVDGSDDDEPLRFAIVYVGTGTVSLQTPFDGFVIAPQGKVRLTGNHLTHRGAFFARDLDVTPGVTVEHRPLDLQAIFDPFEMRDIVALDVGTLVDPSGYIDCDPGLDFVFGVDPDTGDVVPVTVQAVPDPGIPPSDPGCVAPVLYCDENDQPLVPQPTYPDGTGPVPTSCPTLDPTAEEPGFDPSHGCSIVDPATFGAACTTDEECAADEFCAPCGLLDDCNEGERRCARGDPACEAYDGAESCVEFRECPFAGATGTLSLVDYLDDNQPVATPDLSQPPSPLANAIPGPSGTCVGDPQVSSDRDPGSTFYPEDAGQWFVNYQADFDRYYELQSPAPALEKFRAGARAAFSSVARVYGYQIPVVDIGVFVNGDSCEARAELRLKVAGDFTTVPDADMDKYTGVADVDACNDDLPDDLASLPDLLADAPPGPGASPFPGGDLFEQYILLQRAAVDAEIAVNDLPALGLVRELCVEVENDIDPIACVDDLDCPPCDVRDASVADLQYWIDKYEDQIVDFLDARDAQVAATAGLDPLLEIPVAGYDDDILFRAPSVGIPVGPFRIETELGVGGGYQIGLTAEVETQPEPGVVARAGATLEPSLAVVAVAYVGFGFDWVVVKADAGITTTLRIIEIDLPVNASVVLERAVTPDLRPGPYLGQRLFDQQTSYDAGRKYGLRIEGNLLSGKVELTARRRILFWWGRWSKKIADWEGLAIPPLELVEDSDVFATLPAGDFGQAFDLPEAGVLQLDPTQIDPSPSPLQSYPDLGGPCVVAIP